MKHGKSACLNIWVNCFERIEFTNKINKLLHFPYIPVHVFVFIINTQSNYFLLTVYALDTAENRLNVHYLLYISTRQA